MALPSIFLKLAIDGPALTGEVAIQTYVGQIAVDSINWNATAVHEPKSKDEVSTEWRPEHLKFTKAFDRSSGNLYGGMRDRKEFVSAAFTVVDMTLAGTGVPMPMMTLVVEKGFIEDISTRTTESGGYMRIVEDVTLSFRKGTLTYFAVSGKDLRTKSMNFPMPLVPSGA